MKPYRNTNNTHIVLIYREIEVDIFKKLLQTGFYFSMTIIKLSIFGRVVLGRTIYEASRNAKTFIDDRLK